MNSSSAKALQLLEGAEEKLARERAVVGLDGFVDSIIRIVDKRSEDGSATHLGKIPQWAERIQAAAGKSTKFELTVQQLKLGGNGAIMAHALVSFGIRLTCVGNMGFPDLHAVFQPMRKVCDVITIADASYTDAIEFEDGKIMLSRQESARDVTWEALERVIGKEGLFKLFDDATFIALNNWAALPHMSAIWRRMQQEICPRLSSRAAGGRRRIFFDIADPEFRLAAELVEAMKLVSEFQKWFDVTLGLNQKESEEVCAALKIPVEGRDKENIIHRAVVLHSRLGTSSVVVHPTSYAVAASAEGSAIADGPYDAKPLISTGAGDHFNAGYCLGFMLGGALESRLKLGVATSGFYVRTAKSPSIEDLRGFLREIA